mgnify:CR=1 FL=1
MSVFKVRVEQTLEGFIVRPIEAEFQNVVGRGSTYEAAMKDLREALTSLGFVASKLQPVQTYRIEIWGAQEVDYEYLRAHETVTQFLFLMKKVKLRNPKRTANGAYILPGETEDFLKPFDHKTPKDSSKPDETEDFPKTPKEFSKPDEKKDDSEPLLKKLRKGRVATKNEAALHVVEMFGLLSCKKTTREFPNPDWPEGKDFRYYAEQHRKELVEMAPIASKLYEIAKPIVDILSKLRGGRARSPWIKELVSTVVKPWNNEVKKTNTLPLLCEVCGTPIFQRIEPTGEPSLYCSKACRNRKRDDDPPQKK